MGNKNASATIADAYQKSWANLVDMFKDDSITKKNGNISTEEEKNYVTKLRGCIELMLKHLSEIRVGSLSVGRGLVQINSLIFCKRINIWFGGKDKDDWNTYWNQDYWQGPKTGNKLVFFQPDQVKHLLTELMWRFQPQNRNKSKNGNEIKAVIVSKKDMHVFAKASFVKFIPIKNKDILGNEQWVSDMKDGVLKPVTSPKFPLLNRNKKVQVYENDEIIKMLETPKRILFGEKEPYFYFENPPDNIVYVSDIIETDTIGGMEFEFKVTNSRKKLIPKDIETFIDTIRWQLRLVIELISNAEKTYVVSGNVYKKEYFYKDNSTRDSYPALKNIIGSLGKSIRNNGVQVVCDVLKKVNVHFEMANHTFGDHWRGYQRHAYEVARTVGGVIDILWLNKKNIKIEDLICERGPKLEGLNDSLKDQLFFIRQLFRGLEREKDLFLLPQYRDHFIHSYYCFVLGLILMSTENAFVPDTLKLSLDSTGSNEEVDKARTKTLQKWFLVAMWHDIAYILEKGGNVVEKFVLNYLEPKRKYGVLRWSPRLGGLLQVKNLLEEIRIIASNTFSIKSPNTSSIKCKDVVLAVALDQINSTVLIYLDTL